MIKSCASCHQKFTPKRTWQKFCDEPCRREFHKVQRKTQAAKMAEATSLVEQLQQLLASITL